MGSLAVRGVIGRGPACCGREEATDSFASAAAVVAVAVAVAAVAAADVAAVAAAEA